MENKSAFVRNSACLLLLFFACFVVWPVGRMFSSITCQSAMEVFSSPVFRKALCSSLVSASFTTVFSMLLALLMALLVCRTHAGGAVWQVVFILPMLVPSVSLGTGLVLLLGANGFLTRLLHLSGSIYGLHGIVLGQVLYTAPVAFLLLCNILRYEDYTPHEAAMVLGVPARSRFASLTLGHLRRESIAAAFLVFSMAVTDYGIPLAVGGKVKTLATVLYASVAGQQQFGKGCIIGVCLLIPALLAFLFDSGRRQSASGTTRREFFVPHRPVADIAAFCLCCVIGLLFVLPILAFLFTMLLEDYPLHMELTLRHIRDCLNARGVLGLKNSLLLSAGTALGGTVIAAFAAYAAARHRGGLARSVHLLSTLTLSIPGLVLGLAYVLAFKRTALYETMGILIFSSIIHFFTTPYLMLYQTFGKLNANLEGTGLVLGVPPFRLFASVFLPQCAEAAPVDGHRVVMRDASGRQQCPVPVELPEYRRIPLRSVPLVHLCFPALSYFSTASQWPERLERSIASSIWITASPSAPVTKGVSSLRIQSINSLSMSVSTVSLCAGLSSRSKYLTEPSAFSTTIG